MLAAGMGKGTRVGLYFPYGQDWVVAWLAASRIGALVMPLATTYRPAEIRKVLRIGDIDTLLTARVVLGHDMQDMLEASVPGLADATGPRLFLPDAPSLRAVWITDDPDARGRLRSISTRPWTMQVTDELLRAVEAEVMPADLAQVTYTSGSSAIRRAWCTRTAPSSARRPRSRVADRRRHSTPLLLRVPLLLDRGHADPRRRAAERRDRARDRTLRPAAALDLIEAGPGDARARVADPPAGDARRPVVPRVARCPRSPV